MKGKLIAALGAASVMVGVSAVPAAADPPTTPPPPATMSGEHFLGHSGNYPTAVTCHTSGDFSFTVSGAATGPYPGTFTESGTGHVTQPAVGAATVTAFSASFTIYASDGSVLVQGAKTLDTSAPTPGFGCYDGTATGTVYTPTTYNATIYTLTGNYHDEGTSVITALFTDPAGTYLSEPFASTLTQPVLIEPTDKSQCKNGGWQNYPQFKNQGDCVSYVASGGNS
jgi:hypothetical protein